MQTTIRVAHMSDLHYSPTNLQESDRCFGAAVEGAIETKVEVALITGDSTDHRLEAHSPALLSLAQRVKQLADHCPVLLLQGTFTHEPFGMLQMMALIGAKHQIAVADRIGQMALMSDNTWAPYHPGMDAGQLKLVVTCVPTVNKADLAAMIPPSEASDAMGDHLASVLGSFAQINQTLRARGVPTVLASHGTVQGSMSETGVPMAGTDHEFTLGALFSAGTDAVMLGHIHKHQTWQRDFAGIRQTVAYAGSIGRFHHGEIGEKHWLQWEVTPGQAEFTAHVTPSRRMIDIEFTGAPDLDELAKAAAECAGAYVRVRYQIDEEFAKTIDRAAIREILSGSADVKIEGEVLTIQRQRCAGISRMANIVDQFKKWCELSNTPPDGLAERLQMLQAVESETIAAQIIRPTAAIH